MWISKKYVETTLESIIKSKYKHYQEIQDDAIFRAREEQNAMYNILNQKFY